MFFSVSIGVVYRDKSWKDRLYEKIRSQTKDAKFYKDTIINSIYSIRFIPFGIDNLRGYKFDVIFVQDCFTPDEESFIKMRLNPLRLKTTD